MAAHPNNADTPHFEGAKKSYPISQGWMHFQVKKRTINRLTVEQAVHLAFPEMNPDDYEIEEFRQNKFCVEWVMRKRRVEPA